MLGTSIYWNKDDLERELEELRRWCAVWYVNYLSPWTRLPACNLYLECS